MTETWYKTNNWGKRIEAVEVERFTDDSVWIAGRRRARHSPRGSYFQTWVEAKASLMERAEAKVASARRVLELANGELGNIKGMKEPTHDR